MKNRDAIARRLEAIQKIIDGNPSTPVRDLCYETIKTQLRLLNERSDVKLKKVS